MWMERKFMSSSEISNRWGFWLSTRVYLVSTKIMSWKWLLNVAARSGDILSTGSNGKLELQENRFWSW